MRPSCLIRDVLINEVIGCLDHDPYQLLRLLLAQLAEALQAFDIILDLHFEALAHVHAQFIGVSALVLPPSSFTFS